MRIENLVVKLLTGKIAPYVAGGVAGFVGAYLGLNFFEIMFLLLLGYSVAFFGPYQIRRLRRYWRRTRV